MKKFFTLFSTILLISSSLFMNATSSNASTIYNDLCENCYDKFDEAITTLEEEGTNIVFNVNKDDKSKLDKMVKKINNDFLKSELKFINKIGYKHEKNANGYLIFNDLKDNDKVYENVAVVTQFYVGSIGNFVKGEYWIDYANNTLIKYSVDEFSLDENGEVVYSSLAKYDIKANNSDSQFQTYGFKFGGISFACSMSGLLACVAAFGGLATVLPVWGVPLALACEIAFNAGCAVS